MTTPTSKSPAYYLTINSAGDGFMGTGYTPDGTLPEGAIVCPQTVAQNFQSYVPDGKGGYVDAPAAVLICAAQSAQIAIITAAYDAAVTANVAFTTAAGVASTYQADSGSQQILSRTLQSYRVAGAVPSGFYWRSAGNSDVTFTLADLEGLDAAMMTQGWTAFQRKTDVKTQLTAAQSVSAVQAITF